jgi:FKBP-type peptidyl-prolyl cis-trans isomerase 2
MKIEKNKVVSLIYELRETNSAGRIIEALEEAKPSYMVQEDCYLILNQN